MATWGPAEGQRIDSANYEIPRIFASEADEVILRMDHHTWKSISSCIWGPLWTPRGDSTEIVLQTVVGYDMIEAKAEADLLLTMELMHKGRFLPNSASHSLLVRSADADLALSADFVAYGCL